MEKIEIRIKEQIDGNWSDWLGGLTITQTAQGETILRGFVRDQSALYGLLNRLSSLGLRLRSFTSYEEGQGGLKICE
jgi:haloalkane dehalogenase